MAASAAYPAKPKPSGRGVKAAKREPKQAPTTSDVTGSAISRREATVREAKTHLSRLLVEVEAGGTVVITRRGKPVAKLEAVQERPRRVFGSMKGLISIDERFFEPLPEEELKAWEGG